MDFFHFISGGVNQNLQKLGCHISSLLNHIILAPQLDSIGLSLSVHPYMMGKTMDFFHFISGGVNQNLQKLGCHISSLLNHIILAPQLDSIGLSLCSPLNEGKTMDFF